MTSLVDLLKAQLRSEHTQALAQITHYDRLREAGDYNAISRAYYWRGQAAVWAAALSLVEISSPHTEIEQEEVQS